MKGSQEYETNYFMDMYRIYDLYDNWMYQRINSNNCL